MTAFHEAVFLYALALNETIAEGFSSTNGSVITRKMWNRTFTGIAYKLLNTVKLVYNEHVGAAKSVR